MRCSHLFVVSLIVAVFIFGCTQQEKSVVCDPPYMRFGTDCCLDQNGNSICDKDEAQGEINCGEHELGESWPAEDGCNTCSCSERGPVCTKKLCPKKCGEHEIGETWRPDGCNTCTCTESGAACTEMYCANETGAPETNATPPESPVANDTGAPPVSPPANETATISPPACEPPNILSGTACCLDENYNSICDASEGVTTTPGLRFEFSLPTPICGNSLCQIGENSTNCPKDCGCPTGEVLYNGTCAKFMYVPGTSFKAMEICGNKLCKAGVENQSTCCKDCGCPAGQVCSNNKCSTISIYKPNVTAMPLPDSYIVVVIDELVVHDDTDPAGPGELMLVTLAGSGEAVQRMSWPAELWYPVNSGGSVAKRIPVFALKESEMGGNLVFSINAIDNDEMPKWLEGVLAVLTAPVQVILIATASVGSSVADLEPQLDTETASAFRDLMYGNEKIGSVNKVYLKSENWGAREEQYSVRKGDLTVKYTIKKVQVPKTSKLGVRIGNITFSDTGDYYDGEVWMKVRAGTNFIEKDLSGVSYRFPDSGTWDLGDNAKIISGSCTMNERGECIDNPLFSFEQNGPFIFVEVSAWDEDNPEIGDDHDSIGEMSFVYLYSDFDYPPATSTITYEDRVDYPWIVSGKTTRIPMVTRGNMKLDIELTRTTG